MTHGKDMIRYRLERARETLASANLLTDSGFTHGAVNRLYYSCFYAISALLSSEGHSSAKHSGVMALFNRHWIKTGRLPIEHGRLFSNLFDARHEADYADLANYEDAEIAEWAAGAERLILAIESILKD